MPRRYRVSIRVSLQERRVLDAAAAQCGRTFSDYARALLLNAPPVRAARRPSVQAVLLARVLAKLGIIGSALTEIAKSARSASAEITLHSTERDLVRNLRELGICRAQLLRSLGRKVAPA